MMIPRHYIIGFLLGAASMASLLMLLWAFGVQ
jgi:hypothetical protein